MPKRPPTLATNIQRSLFVQVMASLGWPVYQDITMKYRLSHIPIGEVKRGIALYKEKLDDYHRAVMQHYLQWLKAQGLFPGRNCECTCNGCGDNCKIYKMAS